MEALQFLLPCTFCDELVVKGDDCPSWRKSLIVKFNFWLNKTSTYSEMSDSHTKQKKKTSKPTTIERPRTEQLLFFLVPVENPPFIQFLFHHANFQILLHKSRPYKKPSSCEYLCWTRTDGIATTSLRFSTTTGRERTVPGRAPAHNPLLELRTRT